MVTSSKRGVRPDDLYLLRTVSDPRVSPDGRRAAYVVSSNDREADEARSSIYVAPVDGAAPARRFTFGNKDSSPRWSPDGRYLAFVSNRGEENQVFLAPLDGGEARQLTRTKFGASDPAWSPNSRSIAFIARTGDWKDPKERKPIEQAAPRVVRNLAYKLDGAGFFDERRAHVFTIDVEDGSEKQITDGDWNDSNPAWSPNGDRIAFISDRERPRFQRHFRADVWTVASDGGRARKLTRSRGNAADPQFSPDGRWIAYLGHEHGNEPGRHSHLLLIAAEGGPPLSLSAPLDRPVVANPPMVGRTFCWSADGANILFIAADRGTQAIYRAGVANGSAGKLIGGERQIQSFQLAGESLAVVVSAWISAPAELYSTNLTSGDERNLSNCNSEFLEAVGLGEAERLQYVAEDGLSLEAFVLYPPGYERGTQFPLVLQIHGGPHGAHPNGFQLSWHTLAAAGYVVLLPNPRGSSSYGEGFMRGCVGDWGGADYADLMAAVDEMVRRGVANPEDLHVGGYSYGGYMTSWTVGHTDRFRSANVGAPVSDLFSMFGVGDIPEFFRGEIGASPWENPGKFRERSPVTYLANVHTPVLLLHREGDLRCPVGQSEEIFQGLKVLGREVELVRYPGGSHGVATPSQWIDQFRRGVEWCDSHASRAQPVKDHISSARRRRQPASAPGSG